MRNTVDDPRVMPCPTTGCWLWMGRTNEKGYGYTTVKPTERHGANRLAHRVFYEHYVGEVPSGVPLDHICKVRCCVNPDHLRIVTVRENSVTYSDGPTAQNARKTECPVCGSAYSVRYNGYRFCRPCHNRGRAELRRKKKSLGATPKNRDATLESLLTRRIVAMGGGK